MTPVLLVAIVAVVALALWRAPVWVHALLLAAVAVMVGAATSLSGLERGAAPLVAMGLALGLLVPTGVHLGRHARVAPRKGRTARPSQASSSSDDGGFDGVDVPGFDILEKVGSGGMASVFRARRRSDGQTVALKVPMEQYVADAKFIRRFHREAEVAQRLDHPNIVRTYEHGAQGVQHYMAMEFVDGRSL